MAQRVCGETAERCSASAVLRAYMGELVDAIHDAEIPAITMKLYSRKVISRDTRDRVRLTGLIATEKTSCLLEALESAVTTQPHVLDTFLDILDQYRSSAVIAKKMCDRLRHSVPLEMYCETCHQLFCQYCSITDHEAHQYGLVADVFPKHKKELERELAEVKQQLSILTTAQQAMDDRIDQISVQGKEVEQQIHTATQQAIERLQESEEKKIEMVRSEMQRKYNAVYGQKGEVSSKRRCLMDFQMFVEEVIAVSQQQVLTVKHEKMDHVQSVRSKITPSTLQPVEEASIKFIPSQNLLSHCSELGDVNTFHDIAAKTRVLGKGIEIAMAHKTTSFELTTSSFSPFDALSCQLTAPSSSEPVECTITPTQSGGCKISYTPAVRGPHQMRITVGGIDIPNSPFTIHVYPTSKMRSERISTITELKFPKGVAVSKSGEVVVSEGNCITVFDRDGSKIRSFGLAGSGKGKLKYPMGIAHTHDSHILVVDGGNHRVQMFTLEGKFIKSVGQKGKGQLQFLSPRGITVHPSSRQVLIADTDNHRIQVLNDDLTYSHDFGRQGSGNGQFNAPADVACDSHGNVYVVDTLNDRVQVFTSSGQFINSIFPSVSGPGKSLAASFTNMYMSPHFYFVKMSPKGIAIDSMNTVYVSDGANMSAFDNKMRFSKQLEEMRIVAVGWHLVPRDLCLAGLAVDDTGNLLQALPHKGAVAIY